MIKALKKFLNLQSDPTPQIPESYITRLQKKTKFSKEKLLSLKKIYLSLLQPGHLELDKASFTDQINILNNKDNKKMAELIFNALDENNNKTLGFDEFVWYFHLLKNGTKEERLKLSFNIMDVNNDGNITRKEIYDMIKLMGNIHKAVEGYSSLEHLQNEEDIWEIIDYLFESIDADDNGEISLEEFLAANESDNEVTEFFELLSGKGFEEIFSHQRDKKRSEGYSGVLKLIKRDIEALEGYYGELVERRKKGDGDVEPIKVVIGR